MNRNVVKAVFQRNFVSYFSSPTGYVFICVFVLLSSFAAFWPAEFFNANLASLHQLNRLIPYILLIFIPAITMSVWAEEKRQGTDELLLTIPATDFDVVVGKYLAAVAIYSVALVFSMISNAVVLSTLGEPDLGLLLGTYVGYWMIGLAMLATGMVASFLTSNLTVSYILGAIFNAPLAFLSSAELLVSNDDLAILIKRWSVSEQFRDFSRGVLTFSSSAYFILLAVVMIYLAMVLIGRRHWAGGKDGRSLGGHYLVRALALLVIVAAANIIFANHDPIRIDVTSERLSSLSPRTRELIRNLKSEYPIQVDAYVSPSVPEAYVEQRLNLLSALREFQALSGGKVRVNVHEIERFDEGAKQARERFGIEPRPVQTRSRGALTEDHIFLGAAFTSGLEKVVVPFFDRGVSVEYELVRSITTVGQEERKRVGVLITDAKVMGGFNPMSQQSTEKQALITELEKQYDVVQVDPTNPITEKYDVLLAIQPSTLSGQLPGDAQPGPMEHFIDAVLGGQPTVIFEDPFPWPQFFPEAVGTAQEKRPAGGNMFMQQQPPVPKGRIEKLWSRLGIRFNGASVVWQGFNPFPKSAGLVQREWVFVGAGNGAQEPFNLENPISAKLQQVLFFYPGSVQKLNRSTLDFTPLARTGKESGTVPANEILTPMFFLGMGGGLNPDLPLLELKGQTSREYTIAAQIQGVPLAVEEAEEAVAGGTADDAGDEESKQAADAAKAKSTDDKTKVNVVVVADIDCLHSVFFMVRERGFEQEDEVHWDLLDNATFVLNTIDAVAGDDRFIDVRSRRPRHRILSTIEEATRGARDQADAAAERFNREFETKQTEARKAYQDALDAIEKNQQLSAMEKSQRMRITTQREQSRLDSGLAELRNRRDEDLRRIADDLSREIRTVQDRYKFWAVILPPIPPMIVAFFVYFHRRSKELEGVAKTRLR